MKLSDDLRQSVLQAAMEGKLTKQLKEDGNADDLLKVINEERAKPVKEKKIKKSKPLPQISEDEIPFDIPENWRWVKIKDVFDIKTGLSFKKNEKIFPNDNAIRVLRGGNILTNLSYEFKDDDTYVDYEQFKSKFIPLQRGDIITPSVTSLENIGKAALIKESYKKVTAGGFVYIFRIKDQSMLLPKFALYFLSTSFFKKSCMENVRKSGQAFYNLRKSGLIEQKIIIPPLAEQHRIVEKVDALMAEIDELEKKENELEKLRNDFPEDMKASLIQSALEGNLFEDTKNNKKTVDDENLFDIPKSWNWKKLKDVLDIKTGLSFRKAEQIEKNNSSIRVLRGGNISTTLSYELKDNDIYVDFETFKSKYIPLKSGDIITPSVTSMENIGKSALIEKDYKNVTAGGFVYIIRVKDKSILSPKYALYFLVSQFHKEMCKPNIRKSGQAFYNLRKRGLVEQPIVLPPLEEQKRIVEKLDELLPLCETLKEDKRRLTTL